MVFWFFKCGEFCVEKNSLDVVKYKEVLINILMIKKVLIGKFI